jgi:hypothetical protein
VHGHPDRSQPDLPAKPRKPADSEWRHRPRVKPVISTRLASAAIEKGHSAATAATTRSRSTTLRPRLVLVRGFASRRPRGAAPASLSRRTSWRRRRQPRIARIGGPRHCLACSSARPRGPHVAPLRTSSDSAAFARASTTALAGEGRAAGIARASVDGVELHMHPDVGVCSIRYDELIAVLLLRQQREHARCSRRWACGMDDFHN